ncbi:MAG TPA: RNA polymerase subunit sigma-70 [Desulfobulbaceae bacterium]|nr:RNA polymerase subunit sigma-70 [Desulfobulbaceae bacterium]
MADFLALQGRRVAIWPDHDEPGRKAGEAVARAALEAGAVEVSLIEPPPGKAEGWDLADAEAEGWTPEQVAGWIKGHKRPVEQVGAEPTTVEPVKSHNKVVAVDIAAFLAREFPPRANLLSPWLPSQGLAMVYAYRGIGKTHFALGVAYAVASGGSFLGWQAPKPVGVLYIDGEMPGPVMQERLIAIIISNDKEPAAPFILLTPDLQPEGMPRIDTEEGQAAIESILSDEIKLIVVDNISTLSGAKENDGDGWGPTQGWALKQRAAGRSVLFVHHSGKGGAQRGTSRREDVLDTSIALRRPVDYEPDQGAVFEIHFEKARGIHGEDVKSIEATLTTDDHGRMTWRTRTVENSTFDRVVALLNEGMTQGDVATELNINKSSVSRHAKKAKAAGLIETKKGGGA